MRKIFSIALFSLVALSAVILSSCKKEETVGELRILSLYITPIQTVVEKGDTAEINVYASYSNGSSLNVTLEDGITITSSDESIVSYKDGKIVGKGIGKVELTASYMGLSDKSEAVSAKFDHLVLSANYDDNKVLMIPLDTISKKTDLTLTAVLKIGTEEFTKTIESGDYELDVLDNKIKELKDDKFVALESGKSGFVATYITTENGTATVNADVFIAKYDDGEMTLDVDISGEDTDVMLLGSEASIKAEASYVWKEVKCKKKGDTDKDTSTTIDIASKVLLFSKNPQVLGVKETTVSALQIDTGFVYALYEVTETEKDTLTRKVCVMNEESLKTTSYNIELADTSVYAGEEINFKFYANYIRINDGDTTMFRVDLTDTKNDSIVSYCVADSTIRGTVSGTRCNGKRIVNQEYSDGFQIAIVYKHEDAKADTAFSKSFDVYKKPNIVTEKDSVFVGTESVGGNLYSHHDDYIVKDNFGNDLTSKFKKVPIKKVWRFGIPVSEVRNRTLIVIYGPEKREVSKYID